VESTSWKLERAERWNINISREKFKHSVICFDKLHKSVGDMDFLVHLYISMRTFEFRKETIENFSSYARLLQLTLPLSHSQSSKAWKDTIKTQFY
jgi:hypothetical protein